jgi:hypothetical protein
VLSFILENACCVVHEMSRNISVFSLGNMEWEREKEREREREREKERERKREREKESAEEDNWGKEVGGT